ncbi:MAG TPA: hypothetical protein VFX43_06805 [Chitinophagaceae bacterium]|nr:hypothetical protein [Chitinophagaceae bacterium]
MKKVSRPGIFMLTGLLAIFPLVAFGQPNPNDTTGRSVSYRIKSIYLPPEKRPAVAYNKQQLPFRNVGGRLPAFDGEHFSLILTRQRVSSAEAAKKMIAAFLEALKSPLEIDRDIKMAIDKTTASPNQRYIDEQSRLAEQSTEKRISGQYGPLSPATRQYISDFSSGLKAQAKYQVTTYRFDEFSDGTLIDNTALVVVNRSGNDLVSLQGRFYNKVNITNKRALALKEALPRAMQYIMRENNYKGLKGNDTASLVLLPYADGFKYAWKTIVTADGPYRVWIDAENGSVLQLLPDFYFADNANGLVFNPNPNAGTKVLTFAVDPASNGKYTLHLAGVLSLTNNGGDGTSGIITVNDDGSGTANFDVSPINGTTVERTGLSGYNGSFQQVNIYAWIYTERQYYMALGSQDFGQVNVTFNQGGGVNNSFCCPPSYYTCTATTSNSTSCNDLFNAGNDATVVSHEFGHNLNGLQYNVSGGQMTGALNEGMADFWAYTNCNTDVFGAWWAHNCPTPVQSGFVPRQAEALDIFPSHKNLSGASDEAHSAGQIISWANWSARQGMNDATDLGTLSINLNIIRAMTTAGIGVVDNGNDASIHNSYLDLLQQIAPLFSTSRLIHKLLAGYARAGIFLSSKDAVIDINHSYLDRNNATGPTFSLWTGEDYTFSGGNATTSAPPYNTQYMVEVANDPAFTSHLTSSGWLTNVTAGDGGHATWILPSGAWNTLKAGNDLYYRVTTRDANGNNIRQSWNPGNGFLINVPVGRAAINGTGTKDCGCTASAQGTGSAAALLPFLPVAYLVIKRRKKKNNNKA